MKSQRITRVRMSHPLGTMNVSSSFTEDVLAFQSRGKGAIDQIKK